jgi:hypothetical protein
MRREKRASPGLLDWIGFCGNGREVPWTHGELHIGIRTEFLADFGPVRVGSGLAEHGTLRYAVARGHNNRRGWFTHSWSLGTECDFYSKSHRGLSVILRLLNLPSAHCNCDDVRPTRHSSAGASERHRGPVREPWDRQDVPTRIE